MLAGQRIKSLNGSYELLMQTNGNLVEYGPSGAVWATGTPASGHRATMQTDGNFVVYTSGGTALWQSGTGGNSGTFVLSLQNNGNLVLKHNGLAIWTRESSLSAGSPDQTLSSGQSIWSPNGAYELLMQTNGKLVEYGPSGAVWATGTPASGDHVTMQTDGNFVVYTSNGTALWQSGTGGNAGSGGFVLDLENDGNLAIYGVGGLGVMSDPGIEPERWVAGPDVVGWAVHLVTQRRLPADHANRWEPRRVWLLRCAVGDRDLGQQPRDDADRREPGRLHQRRDRAVAVRHRRQLRRVRARSAE